MAAHKKSHCKRGHPRTPDNVAASGHCITCSRAASKKWLKDNKDKARTATLKWHKEHPGKARIRDRKSKLKRVYGIDVQDVPYVCEVCGKDNGKRAICIDHDHETGKVRGFLCGNCNRALGLLKDDPALLEKLALYLRGNSG